MKKSTTVFGAGLCSVLVTGALAGRANAEERRPGIDFKAVSPASAACLQVVNNSALRNICGASHEVVATLPNLPLGPHPTSVRLFGSVSSGCQSMTVNPFGIGLDIGPVINAGGGIPSWQLLDTGIRNSLGWTPLVFRCTLEPGAAIGMFGAL